ncbi:MAG TPA: uracil-DNA glycosylase [Desulfobacterales bacterium]|nr:uracil-DNA glycosylase [Desulfobacterales bacterium]
MGKHIDCHRCEHYYVTWDKRFPHGCHAMKFKSKDMPSHVVISSSGIPCQLFETKDRGGKRGRPSRTPVKDQF